MKERLRRAYNENRLGLPQSDPSVPLFVNVNEGGVLDEHVIYKDDDESLTKDHSLKGELPDPKEQNKDLNPINQNVVIGGALKRGSDGEFIIPMKKRKIRKIKKKQVDFLVLWYFIYLLYEI